MAAGRRRNDSAAGRLAARRRRPYLCRMSDASADGRFPLWRQPDGSPVSCREKIKVLNENLAEIEQAAQDALEDAVLMGCDEEQVRETLHALVDRLANPYRKA
jgi:hypothetical protein